MRASCLIIHHSSFSSFVTRHSSLVTHQRKPWPASFFGTTNIAHSATAQMGDWRAPAPCSTYGPAMSTPASSTCVVAPPSPRRRYRNRPSRADARPLESAPTPARAPVGAPLASIAACAAAAPRWWLMRAEQRKGAWRVSETRRSTLRRERLGTSSGGGSAYKFVAPGTTILPEPWR
jgi:hypothetical protein